MLAPGPRAPGRRRSSGFTLIELLIAMILIGVAFAYGIVKIDLLVPSSRLEKAARDLGGMLTRLRGMAVFRGRSYFLEYDLDNHLYRLYRPATFLELDDGADEYIETSWLELPDRVSFKDVQFNGDDVVDAGTADVEFAPTGEVTGHLVHLVSSEIADEVRRHYTIELNPITGLVTYTRGEKPYGQVRDEFEFR
ncbi:MAG: pilus assembly FimT family protein [Planctomycetota bacterium]|jgi:prepilin-type N-terminal cleavage/methylation domain-containing protein